MHTCHTIFLIINIFFQKKIEIYIKPIFSNFNVNNLYTHGYTVIFIIYIFFEYVFFFKICNFLTTPTFFHFFHFFLHKFLFFINVKICIFLFFMNLNIHCDSNFWKHSRFTFLHIFKTFNICFFFTFHQKSNIYIELYFYKTFYFHIDLIFS